MLARAIESGHLVNDAYANESLMVRLDDADADTGGGDHVGWGHSMPQSSSGAALSVAARSQQDASALVGTWELTDFSRRATDGRITAPWGSHPAGQITYDADGHVTALLMHEERNEAGGRPSPREVQAEFSAYFGTYTVDATQQIVTHQVRGSLSAERASGELRRNYELKDGSLILTFTRPQDAATNTLVWKRISRVRP